MKMRTLPLPVILLGLLLATNIAQGDELRHSLHMIGALDTGALQLRLDEKLPELRRAIDVSTTGSIDTSLRSLGDSSEIRGSIATALERDAGLRASLSDVDVAKARTLRAMAAFMPTINGTLSQNLSKSVSTNGSVDKTTTGAINLSMPLYAGGQNINGLRSANRLKSATQFEARSKADQIIFNVISAHVQLDFAAKQVDIAATNVASLGRLRNSVNARISAGLSSEADLADIDAQLAAAKRQAASARGAVAQAADSIRAMTGKSPATANLSTARLETLFKGGKQSLIATARSQSPTILSANERAQAANFASRAAFGKYLPRVDLAAGYEHDLNSNLSASQERDRYSVSVQLKVPLVDFNTMADVKEARASASAAMYRAQDTAHEIETQISGDWENYQSMNDQLQYSGAELQALGRSLKGKQKQFEAGLINVDDVARQVSQLASAQLSAAQMRAERHLVMLRIALYAGFISR